MTLLLPRHFANLLDGDGNLLTLAHDAAARLEHGLDPAVVARWIESEGYPADFAGWLVPALGASGCPDEVALEAAPVEAVATAAETAAADAVGEPTPLGDDSANENPSVIKNGRSIIVGAPPDPVSPAAPPMMFNQSPVETGAQTSANPVVDMPAYNTDKQEDVPNAGPRNGSPPPVIQEKRASPPAANMHISPLAEAFPEWNVLPPAALIKRVKRTL